MFLDKLVFAVAGGKGFGADWARQPQLRAHLPAQAVPTQLGTPASSCLASWWPRPRNPADPTPLAGKSA